RDAGHDGGMEPEDGGMDAGEVGTALEGEPCTASRDCAAGLRCESPGDGGASACRPLHLAFTRTEGADLQAVAVRYNQNTLDATPLSEGTGSSRFPRWSRDGTRVAFVRADEEDAEELVVRPVPFASGDSTVVVDGGMAGTAVFNHL